MTAQISDFPTGQVCRDIHTPAAGGGSFPATDATMGMSPKTGARPLLDPFLTLASVTVDDLEALRIAQENRYRSLTGSGVSEDGVEWGYGLTDDDPEVAKAGALVDSIAALEHGAVLSLQRAMRRHPLGPWVKAQRGIGDKQAARLLGVIGDPYWHTAEGRPRTVSELWAYCGLHTLPVGGDGPNVAARRRRGAQANWSDDAKKRVWLIATSCVKAGGPYRVVYDERKTRTADRVHAVDCIRCGPSGKPALAGSAWSDGHKHADALRIMSKAILRDLWREAKRIHEEREG